ncbi:MAG TPA: hypothetical protein PLR25_24680 [Planctomycetaceae bacterium]|nr:hypothetical protein [Planctomycetaceae bacterium]
MTWFDDLVGFREQSGDQVRSAIEVDADRLRSRANEREFRCGILEVVSLHDLRKRTTTTQGVEKRLRLSEVVGNVQSLHQQSDNAGALFQVASQFNLLEMVSPSVTPDDGIGIYENDRTQGPACAIAAGAGTIYRNYFAPVNGKVGQSAADQIDCLQGIGVALGNQDNRLWRMRNGYAIPSDNGLREIHDRLLAMEESERDDLRQRLQIGIQWDTQVTLGDCQHSVTQAYCSALPVAYSSQSSKQWEPLARLVLDAAYEATLHVALLNAERTGNRQVYLTLLGGGAFGNDSDWIMSAIERAVRLFATADLDIFIVSYRASNSDVQPMIDRLR